MQLIRASITAGIRPTAMILHAQPADPWTKHDFNLLEAYQIIQDETCRDCGLPVWICQNDSEDIQFNVRKVVCNATRQRELEEESRGKDAKKPHGESLRPEPFAVSGEPLSSFREPYYMAEMKRRQDEKEQGRR